ncbi:MAG: TonB-dependent receptor, partial [Bacteroidota bacterium]
YIEYKIDKKVINVSQDIVADGGTAIDVLENTPSVNTDIEGNVTVRGSSNFTVLIDGKPTIFTGSDALQQIPAGNIESIEIITNPSAKYDPEGTAGIINVIMKKQKERGFNGIINASTGAAGYENFKFPTTSSIDGLFNYRMGKLNLFGGFDYDERNNYSFNKSTRESNFDTVTYYRISDAENNRLHGGYEAKAGFDYYFDDNNTLTLSGEFGNSQFGRSNHSKISDYDLPSTYQNYIINENDFIVSHNSYSVNGFFEHKFPQKDHKLTFMGYFASSDGNNEETLDEYQANNNWDTINTGQAFKQRIIEASNSMRTRLQADYTKPVSKNSKLEAGVQCQLYEGSQDYILSNFDYDLGQFSAVDSMHNNIDFNRTIFAVYSTISGFFKGFEFLAGLRGEYTDRVIKQNVENIEYPVNRFDYFPSFHISRPITETQQIQASYSRRINRPREYYLDPFKNFSDRQSVRMGNPELEPEYTDSYELNYQKRFKESNFVSFEAYHRRTNNLITRVQSLGNDNILYMTFENLDKDFSTGVELMAFYQIFKWWQINASGNFFNYHIDGQLSNSEEVNQVTNTWNTRISNTIKLKWGTRLQIDGNYVAPSITAQGERDGFLMANLAVKQEFMKRSLTVTFRVRDPFRSGDHNFTSYGTNFTTTNESRRIAPSYQLTLSYKINNYKQKKRDGQGGEDMNFDDGGEM